ncbi:MAG: hypothetical protein ACR2KX_14355 [Chitinophagaceae bacterium]
MIFTLKINILISNGTVNYAIQPGNLQLQLNIDSNFIYRKVD